MLSVNFSLPYICITKLKTLVEHSGLLVVGQSTWVFHFWDFSHVELWCVWDAVGLQPDSRPSDGRGQRTQGHPQGWPPHGVRQTHRRELQHRCQSVLRNLRERGDEGIAKKGVCVKKSTARDEQTRGLYTQPASSSQLHSGELMPAHFTLVDVTSHRLLSNINWKIKINPSPELNSVQKYLGQHPIYDQSAWRTRAGDQNGDSFDSVGRWFDYV